MVTKLYRVAIQLKADCGESVVVERQRMRRLEYDRPAFRSSEATYLGALASTMKISKEDSK